MSPARNMRTPQNEKSLPSLPFFRDLLMSHNAKFLPFFCGLLMSRHAKFLPFFRELLMSRHEKSLPNFAIIKGMLLVRRTSQFLRRSIQFDRRNRQLQVPRLHSMSGSHGTHRRLHRIFNWTLSVRWRSGSRGLAR